MDIKQIVVLITAPSAEVAEKISNTLLENKLAACVNIVPSINSLYIWEGEINNDEEVLLIIKTRYELFDDTFIKTIKEQHPYDVPEIIALPIVIGSEDYLHWITNVTKKK